MGSGTGGNVFSGAEGRRDHLAQRVVLGRGEALLADRRVVVVARDVGLVSLAARVRAGREAEVRSPVNHVEVEGLLRAQEERDLLLQVLERGARPLLTPVGEPAGVGLRGEDGDTRGDGARQRPVLFLGAGVQPDRRALHVPGLEHVGRGSVRGKEGDVNPVLHPHVLQPAHVRPVVAVAAVLVLDLQHHDRAAARDEQRPHHLRQLRDVPLGRGHVPRVQAANPDVRVAQQVGGDAAEIPLGADVGPGPQQHPHALFLRDLDEAGDVAVRGAEVEHALGGLVEVPEDVGGNRVAAHRLRHPDSVTPVLGRDAGRVHFPGDDLERLSVEQEILAAHRERVARALPRRAGRGRHQDHHRRENRESHKEEPSPITLSA